MLTQDEIDYMQRLTGASKQVGAAPDRESASAIAKELKHREGLNITLAFELRVYKAARVFKYSVKTKACTDYPKDDLERIQEILDHPAGQELISHLDGLKKLLR